jgi:hypothetical protein
MPFDLSEQRLQETEAIIGATLPASYRTAMMAGNGGAVQAAGDDWALCPIHDASDRKRLARSTGDIVTETARCREWRGFPQDAVVIALNGSGDCMVFRRDGGAFDPAPTVWRHESGATHRVADDFAALHPGPGGA